MGEKPADLSQRNVTALEKELNALRERTQELIVELESRVSKGVTQARSTVARVRYAVDLRARLREHPLVVAVGLGVVVALGGGVYLVSHRLVRRRQRGGRALDRLERRLRAYGAIVAQPHKLLRPSEPLGKKLLATLSATVLGTVARMVTGVAVRRALPAARS